MKGDLLAIPNDPEDSPNFRNAFWGADHKGFEVLYASLKSYVQFLLIPKIRLF